MTVRTGLTPAEALREARSVTEQYKASFSQRVTTMAAGNVAADYVLACRNDTIRARTRLGQLGQTAGLVAYAQAQYEPTYDVVAEYQALFAAMDSLIDGISSGFPVDVNGFLLEKQFSADGYAFRQFTPAQTSGIRSLITAVTDLID